MGERQKARAPVTKLAGGSSEFEIAGAGSANWVRIQCRDKVRFVQEQEMETRVTDYSGLPRIPGLIVFLESAVVVERLRGVASL